MYCPKCGMMAENGTQFCQNCGAPLNVQPIQQPQQMPEQQVYYQQQPCYQQPQQMPNQQPGYAEYQGQYAQQPYYVPVVQEKPLGMGWFKFLIYFSLFASAVLSVASAVNLFTGSVYGQYASQVYATYSSLRILDVVVGILMIGLAGFAIFTRFRLSGFYTNGPLMLKLVYILNAVVSLVHTIGIFYIVGGTQDLVSSTVSSIIVPIIMVAVNTKYFNKRAHLFVNY